jgi:hypothetical protein
MQPDEQRDIWILSCAAPAYRAHAGSDDVINDDNHLPGAVTMD